MILSTPLPPKEGIGFYAWNLSQYLTDNGHQVHLITRGDLWRTSYENVDSITVWKLPFLPLYPIHVHFHAFFVNRLLQRLEKEFDIVHMHSPLVMAPKTRLPVLVTVHTPLKADIRSVQTKGLLGILIRLQAPFSLSIESRLFQVARKFVAVASSVAEELSEYGIKPSDVTVVGNGVDIDLFAPGSLNGGKRNPCYFLTVCRLAPRKGLDDLVKAAKIVVQRHPDIKFFIAGDGSLAGDLARLIAKEQLNGNVFLLGHISDRLKMIQFYRGCIAYIHPAHYEGLSTVLLEAMACGKAVISTSVSGALDVINNERNGLLVQPRNPEELAKAIIRILEHREMANCIGKKARDTVCEKYSWQVVGARYVSEYKALLERV